MQTINPKDIDNAVVARFAATGTSVDNIMIEPQARAKFVGAVLRSLGCPDEEEILRRLMTLRKKGGVTKQRQTEPSLSFDPNA